MFVRTTDFLNQYPRALIEALTRLAARQKQPLYVAGGPVRDWFMGRPAMDLDITVPHGAMECAQQLQAFLGGAYVPLDQKEDVARVVWQGYPIDFAAFREGASTIEQDLLKRDFTINAMALTGAFADSKTDQQAELLLLDPAGGLQDLERETIRLTDPQVFTADPLRMLRAYRFMACLGFSLDFEVAEAIRWQSPSVLAAAPERLAYELRLIIGSRQPGPVLKAMSASGLLDRLFPEIAQGRGVGQPASHHLDVFEHNLAALEMMVLVQDQPEKYFPGSGQILVDYLNQGKRRVWLRWAALFHDLGKPATHRINQAKGGRITFYNHDVQGAAMVRELAFRFKWSREDRMQVSRLIARHMWPFHLNNARCQKKLTARAFLKLAKTMGEELPGLFLLAMADSLAGQGEGKPPAMEEAIGRLYQEAMAAWQEVIKPVLKSPRLITGHDLMDIFQLVPGPLFTKIFAGLEKAQVDGRVTTRQEALAWVRLFLSRPGQGG